MTDRPSDPRPAPHPEARPGPNPDALWARYRAGGDPAHLGAFFDATAPSLFRIALSLVHDATAAEDAVQETYLAALEHADRHDAERPVMPWFVGILRVMVKRSRRDVTRTPDPVRLAAVKAATAADDLGGEGEDAERIRRAIDALDEPYRSVAVLRWRYGLEPAEIADVRSENPGTTRSLLSRALAQLREALRGAPAFFRPPRGARALDAVRAAVLARGAALRPAAAAAGVGAGVFGLSVLAKAGIAAAVVAAVAVGVVVTRGPGAPDRSASSSAAAPAAPAAPTAGPLAGSVAGPASTPPAGPATVPPVEPPDSPPVPPLDPPPTDALPPAPPDPVPPAPTPPATLPPDGPVDDAARPPLVEPERPRAEDPAPLPPPKLTPEDPMPPASPAAPAAPAQAAPPPADADPHGVGSVLGKRINGAIDRGVAYLRSTQLPDGSWGVVEGNAAYDGKPAAGGAYTHPAGPTALALYALLKSEVPLDDPQVRRGFAFLRTRHRVPGGAYELSALLLALTATAAPVDKQGARDDEPTSRLRFPAGEWRAWAMRVHEELLDRRARAKTQGWRYQLENDVKSAPAGGNEDLSSTQLAALALAAAERCGIKTDSRVWSDIIAFTLRQQEPTGPAHPRAVVVGTAGGTGVADHARGFAYIRSDRLDPDEGAATGGMTACGIATLQLARYVLAQRQDKGLARDAATIQQAIWDGLAWLDLHWSPYKNPQKRAINVYHVYYLYCMERAFDLLGNHRLGPHFWYPEMAEQLLARQGKTGFWDSASTHKPRGVLDTAFALLFLRRSTRIIQFPSLTDPSDTPPADQRGK
ncbi:MAG: sigma-70 family RNA polymerase sigma factor [Planctomycetia bacterium]|nr:sigma-70 family RNA polymerase sigma factor [Planctomycetia bacterium]